MWPMLEDEDRSANHASSIDTCHAMSHLLDHPDWSGAPLAPMQATLTTSTGPSCSTFCKMSL